ncbi:Tn3 family transposase [Streptomyces griseus]|uniref:Tn3 family transposase n=1 Tax=Streptomyces griseus TaxID=1911 RepID=UPI000D1AC425
MFYGKDGDLTGSDKESQEVSMLALHLLQSALVHVNTLSSRTSSPRRGSRRGSPTPTGGPCPRCSGRT